MDNSSFGGYSNDFWAAKVVQLLIALGAFWGVLRLVDEVNDPVREGGAALEHILAFVLAGIGVISAGYFVLNWKRELDDPLDKPNLKTNLKRNDSYDDLTKIEGIGPKIAELLRKDGYRSFEDIAGADPQDLKAVLDEAGSRYKMHETKSWPKQARMAADGDWKKLARMQDKLNAGRTKKA